MSPTAAWILIIMAVAAAAIIGFYSGRHTAPGKRQVDALQKELDENRQAMTDYRQSVSRHFEKTATLFTSMAGSYRELYDHLRESYGDLTDTPGRPLLPESAGALLEGEKRPVAGSERPPEVDSAEKTAGRTGQDAAASGTDSEDMLGDAPYIPRDLEMEEAPERPITTRRDEQSATNGSPSPDAPREGTEPAADGDQETSGEGDTPGRDGASERERA
ncbi:YhcB family protein [Thioalkalivibrio thiocyanodenitrificans]|uniref:YhcB family protein n=1 Tax=Thioalkalivibrio thiocyanodenitrificans TaxID=243063 RepID=UPI00037E9055|nr:DUF1043 family protein [Thioalkalivibrio thiocyanodenitrificans]